MKLDWFDGRTPEEVLRENLRPRDVPTFAELIKRHPNPRNLPITLRRMMGEYADTSGNYSDYEKAQKDLHLVYQCWALVKSGDVDASEIFGDTLDNPRSFTANYVPDITPKGRENLFRMTGDFRNEKVHPSRLLEIYPPGTVGASRWVPDIYLGRDSWVHLPFNDMTLHFVAKKALSESVRNPDLKRGYSAFHSTNSSALAGIEKHNAILSSFEALARGQEVLSGEHVFYSKGWVPKGLVDVYAKSSLLNAYGIPGWFGDFPVTFRIDLERLNYYRKETGGKPISHRDDIAGEGILMGKEVPLRFVDAVYGYLLDLPRLRSWVERVAPSINVYSYEGDKLLIKLRLAGKGRDYLSKSEYVRADEAITI